MKPYLTDEFGNPGGNYCLGFNAKKAVDNARQQVADFFNCDPESIIFTSGGSEGNNTVIRSARPNSTIVVSNIEHDSILNAVKDLHIRNYNKYELAKVKSDGTVGVSDIRNVCGVNTGLISVMYVNNETGVKNDIKKIAEFCHDRCIPFHSDCVQAAGNYELDVNELGVDYATISSHKIHGPKGVGAIYASPNSGIIPLISGGDNQEFGLRGGTENVPGIVGFGKACEIAKAGIKETQRKMNLLKNTFMDILKYRIGAFVEYNAVPDPVGKILNFRVVGVDSQSLILALSCDVCLSAGSACTSHNIEPSHVLRAMGIPIKKCMESVRVSFDAGQSCSDIVCAADSIAEAVQNLRNAGS